MPNGAKQLIETLECHDVEYVFGVCGDTSIGFYRVFEEIDSSIDHILARDERSAGYMADAYARLAYKPGVTEGPSGGGATYLIPGITESNDSSIPVVGMNTTIPVKYRGRGVLTELDQEDLFDGVTKWNTSVEHAEQVPRLVRRAFREATTGHPGATHLSFPMDVLAAESEGNVYADGDTTSYPAHRPHPGKDRIEETVEILADSDRPLAVAGGGVHSAQAWNELRTVAETIGMPVAQTLTSAGCIGDSPYSIGVVGENGYREYANEMVEEADTIFLFGTAVESVWSDKWNRPADGEKRLVHADIHAESIGKNYETEVALPGDLKIILEELIERVEPREAWSAETIARRHDSWISEYTAEFDSDSFPLRPERMVEGANEVLDDDAVIISDPGTSCPYFAAFYEFTEPGRHWITPRAHGALGYTIPAVVGAHYAVPDQQVIGFTGDGSAGMSLGEFETLGRLDVPVTVVIVNNGSYSWIEAGQRNYDDFSFAVDFDGIDFASIAESFGLSGFRVRSADEYEQTLTSALETSGPAVVDLPTQRLPEIENVPVTWLEPAD